MTTTFSEGHFLIKEEILGSLSDVLSTCVLKTTSCVGDGKDRGFSSKNGKGPNWKC